MMGFRKTSAEIDNALSDRILHSIRRSRVLVCDQHNRLHALSPGMVLCPQMCEFLPDAHLVGLRGGQQRFVQDVKRNIGQFVHSRDSTLVSWGF
jgi:hypothetical protein